mmetsp:Transcript_34324/g.67594  ORF Transcript_34324/g.67594 Transcript_34324/m.67594 type:complete len:3977 (-) Transcript_34324:239-12169(-)
MPVNPPSGLTGTEINGNFQLNWLPTTAGVYALQIRIGEKVGKLYSPYDFLLEVVTGGNFPQFSPPTAVELAQLPASANGCECCEARDAQGVCTKKCNYCPFYKSFERSFIVTACSKDQSEIVSIESTTLPFGASFNKIPQPGGRLLMIDPYDPNWVAQKSCNQYVFRWTPAIDAVSSTITFQAVEKNSGKRSLGTYGFALKIVPAAFIYVSGVIRDFTNGEYGDFGYDCSASPCTTGQLVQTNLNADNKPAIIAPTPSIQNFDKWYALSHPADRTTVFSTQLVQLPGEDVFTFASTFLPINGRLGGNNDGQGLANQDYNSLFTYEVNSYIRNKPGLKLKFKASDDMWVFIDKKLPVGWDLGGIHAEKEFVIDMGTQFPTLSTRDENDENIFRCDIFYASRGKKSATELPKIFMQLNNASVCDALSTGRIELDYKPSGWKVDTGLSLIGAASRIGNAFQLTNRASDFGAVWATVGDFVLPVKVLQGFQASFTFQVDCGGATTCTHEGFAFVMQNSAAEGKAAGGAAYNLGYSGIGKSIAVEFDMLQNSETNDPNYQHVGIHTDYTGKVNSANEAFTKARSLAYDPARGNDPTNGPKLTMNNGTKHEVVIEYAPGQNGAGTGFLRVKVGQLIRRVVELQVDGLQLKNTLFPDGAAYVGFTSGSSQNMNAGVKILDWSMKITQIYAKESSLIGQPLPAIAGKTQTVQVQARDQCGTDFQVGEEQDNFALKLTSQTGLLLKQTNDISKLSEATVDAYVKISSNFDGTYRIDYAAKAAGKLSAVVTYKGVDIKGMDPPVVINVSPAEVDNQVSRIIAGARGINEYPTTSKPVPELVMLAADPTNGEVTGKIASNAKAALDSWYQTNVVNAATKPIVAVSLVFSQQSITTITTNYGAVLNKLATDYKITATSLRGSKFGSFAAVAPFGGTGVVQQFKELANNDLQVFKSPNGFSVEAAGLMLQWATLNELSLQYSGYVNVRLDIPAFQASNQVNYISFLAKDGFSNIIPSDLASSFVLSITPSKFVFPAAPASLVGAYGYYRASFTSTVSGSYKLTVGIKDANGVASPLKDSPLDFEIVAGPADAPKCSANGNALYTAQAGELSSFSLILRDIYNNQQTRKVYADRDSVQVTLVHVSSSQTLSTTKKWDPQQNAYTIEYTAQNLGDYAITILINGKELKNEANQKYKVVVTPGPVFAPNCFASKDPNAIVYQDFSAQQVQAGIEQTFYVQAVDRANNLRVSPNPTGQEFGAVFTDITGKAYSLLQSATFQFQGNGKYALRFVPKESGVVTMNITAGPSESIGPSNRNPVQLTVTPGPPSGLSSVVIASSNSQGTAGTLLDFLVDCKDRAGNPVVNCASTAFIFAIVNNGQLVGGVTSNAVTAPTSTQVKWQWNATKSGPYQISCKAIADAQKEVVSAPYAATVSPGVASKVVATGNGVLGGKQSTPVEANLRLQDEFSNFITATETAIVTAQLKCSCCSSPSPAVTVTKPQDGQRTLKYNIPSEINTCHSISVSIAGKEVYNNKISVFANDQTCYTDLSAVAKVVKAGEPLAFPVPYYTDATQSTPKPVSGVNGDIVFNALLSNGAGEDYRAVSTVTAGVATVTFNQDLIVVPGDYKLTMRVFTTACNVDATVKVVPADVHEPSCQIVIDPANRTSIAGSNLKVSVTLNDRFFNKVNDSNFDATLSLKNVFDQSQTATKMNYLSASGLWQVSQIVEQAGQFEVRVFDKSFQELGPPPRFQTLVVSPDVPDKASCIFRSKGAKAGEASEILVTLRDRFNNTVTDAKYGISAPSPWKTVSIGSGQFKATAIFNKAETLNVDVNLTPDNAVYGNVQVVVTAGDVDADKSTVVAANGTAGQELTFVVQAKDQFNNDVSNGVLVPRLVDPAGLIVPASFNRTGSTYTVTAEGKYTKRAGEYNWNLRFNGNALQQDSKWKDKLRQYVNPSTVQIDGTTFLGATSSGIVDEQSMAGNDLKLYVTYKDQYGNAITNLPPTSQMSVQFYSIQADGTPVDGDEICGRCNKILDDDGGTQSCTSPDGSSDWKTARVIAADASDLYTPALSYQVITAIPNKLGYYWIGLTYNADKMTCTAWQLIKIVPGAVSPPDCVVTHNLTTSNGKFELQAGKAFSVDVFLKDKYGNDAYSSGVQLVPKLADGQLANVTKVTFVSPNKYVVTAFFVKAGSYANMQVSIVAGPVSGQLPFPTTAVEVTPAVVKKFLVSDIGSPVAGYRSTFTLTSRDQYDNIASEKVEYDLVLKLLDKQNLVRYSVVPQPDAANLYSYTSLWDGDFQLEVTLFSTHVSPKQVVNTGIVPVKIAPIKCPATTPIRCDSQAAGKISTSCVKSYADCKTSAPCNVGQKQCWVDGTAKCVNDKDACPCPAGTTRCAGDFCSASCPTLPSACPAYATQQCKDSSGNFNGFCRKALSDCPSPRVCPPDTALCPDGSCVNTGPNHSNTSCPDLKKCTSPSVACFDGTCASAFEDCPTPKSCGTDKVVCPDGSCQASASQCTNQFACGESGAIRCPDGSCAQPNSCPTGPTCPSGYIRCENGECLLSVSDCSSPISCSQHRCPDGSCVSNPFLCPSSPTCPSATPVRCSDASCRGHVYECVDPQRCPTGQKACPDGSCTSGDACPSRTRCPAEAPVLCTSGNCVSSVSNCPELINCPSFADIRCPDGACRASLSDCPTGVSCPAERPLKCLDGSCKAATSLCASVASLQCPPSQVRCPVGSCSSSFALCPEQVVCSGDQIRCEDGTCRTSCDAVYNSNPCQPGKVPCPLVGIGNWCADSTVANCSSVVLCPPASPVRCFDGSCTDSVSRCAKVPLLPPTETSRPCPDGSWTAGSCPSPTQCPADTPFLCWDNSCRRVPTDCPKQVSCPADKPYRCGNVCTRDFELNILTCQSNDAQCPAAEVKCPGGNVCKASVDLCPSTKITCSQTCFDGSCATDAVTCSKPVEYCQQKNQFLRHVCEDGMCAQNSTFCHDPDTGCPYDSPYRCQSGSCVRQAQECPSLKCEAGKIACSGFCVSPQLCARLAPNQCEQGYFRCLDRRCVASQSECVQQVGSNLPNVCPTSLPFRCPNGYCAETSVLCPTVTPAYCAGSGKSFGCADGTCVDSEANCPVVVPCNNQTETRCPDSSCRPKAFVSRFGCPQSTCRDLLPYPCADSGLCAKDEASCIDVKSGCPKNQNVKCPQTGACVSDISQCEDKRPPNGCPADRPEKCWYGECVVKESSCLDRNLCPVGQPNCVTVPKCPGGVECADGTCAPSKTQCIGGNVKCFTCANGQCVTDVSQCLTAAGCPLATPHRCADGSCKEYEASADLPPAQNSKKCHVQVVCEDHQVLCNDGTCRSDQVYCGAVPQCTNGTIRCADGTCLPSSSCPDSCPVTSPIKCASGQCRVTMQQCPEAQGQQSLGQAPTPGVSVGCTIERPYRCFDGSCKESPQACMKWQAFVKDPTGAQVNIANICGANATLCSDGTCKVAIAGVKNLDPCPIISRCEPKMYRCNDGSCKATCTAASLSCPAGQKPCEDGICRTECLPFDGCKLGQYACPNRECAASAAGCTAAANTAQTGSVQRRRLLQANQLAKPCVENCIASVKASQVSLTVSPAAATDVVIGLKNERAVAYLKVPSGSVLDDSPGEPLVTILPVADSAMMYAENAVHPSRMIDKNNDAGANIFYFTNVLTYTQSVLSVAIECVVPKTVTTPFASPVEYKAEYDATRNFLLSPYEPADICLAYIYEIKSLGYTRWTCVEQSVTQRKTVVDQERRRSNDFVNNQIVTGEFTDCGEDGQGKIFAFIHSPVPRLQDPLVVEKSWVEKNILALLLILMLITAIIVGCFYTARRLHRYRQKYHMERKQVDKMQDEVDEMEQFGGQAGTKDDQVVMSANPLVMQVKDLEKKMNEHDEELERARQQEANERSEHIKKLATDRDEMAKELERLQNALGAQSSRMNLSPVTEMEMMDSASVTGGSQSTFLPSVGKPKRTEFKAKARKKKSLN